MLLYTKTAVFLAFLQLITNNLVTLRTGNVHHLAKISAGVDTVKATNVAKT